MNEMKLFKHEVFGKVRTIMIDGKPYAAGTDVAKALAYTRPNDAIHAHCRGTVKCSTPISGKMQEINFIPEGDMYRLIVKAADQSKSKTVRDKAEAFERWLFDEVLPNIRKTGSYSHRPNIDLLPHMAGVASYLRIQSALMKNNGSTPQQIVEMSKQTCEQLGIWLPGDFTEPNYQQLKLLGA